MSGPGTWGWDEEALELKTKASARTFNAEMLPNEMRMVPHVKGNKNLYKILIEVRFFCYSGFSNDSSSVDVNWLALAILVSLHLSVANFADTLLMLPSSQRKTNIRAAPILPVVFLNVYQAKLPTPKKAEDVCWVWITSNSEHLIHQSRCQRCIIYAPFISEG